MRALFELAALLGTTVAALSAGLSAQEFTRWQVWMQAEQQGARWQAAHRAEMLAAVHNGGQVKRKDNAAFATADFMPADPWAEQRTLTPAEEEARQAAEYEALLRHLET